MKVINDNIVFIDYSGKQSIFFKSDGSLIKFLGRKGQGPGEFMGPLVATISGEGDIYIADHDTRRINIYNSSGEFRTSFILSGQHWTPHIMRINSKGMLLLGGYKADFKKPNTGPWINIYNKKGKYMKSFFPTNPRASGNLIRPFSKCWFELDENDILYAIQETDYKIYKFNSEFKLLEEFGNVPSYYSPPNLPPNEKGVKSINELREKREKYYASWTQLVNLTVIKSHILILLETNGLKGIKSKFILDIYNKDGDLILGGIQTDYKFICKDKNNNLYFLIYSDEESLEKEPQYIIGKYQLKLD